MMVTETASSETRIIATETAMEFFVFNFMETPYIIKVIDKIEI